MSKRVYFGRDDFLYHFLPAISLNTDDEKISFQWLNFYVDIYLWRKRYV